MESWVTLAIAALVVPSVAWLVREVLSLRGKMIELETRMDAKDRDCDRHQRQAVDVQRALSRIDRNVARLCQVSGITEGD
jgi:hypothetical protein